MSEFSSIAFRMAARLALVAPDTVGRPTVSNAEGTLPVIITGTGFAAVAPRVDAGQSFTDSVYVGTTRVADFTVDSDTQITANEDWNGDDSLVVNTRGGCALFAGVANYLATEDGDNIIVDAGDRLRV